MTSYNWGETPLAVIAAALPDRYPMELAGRPDIEMVTRLVNQGIDSHLEAVTFAEPPAPTPQGKLRLVFDRPGMLVFMRRLREEMDREPYEPDASEDPPAMGLRSAILSTLDIEEI